MKHVKQLIVCPQARETGPAWAVGRLLEIHGAFARKIDVEIDVLAADGDWPKGAVIVSPKHVIGDDDAVAIATALSRVYRARVDYVIDTRTEERSKAS